MATFLWLVPIQLMTDKLYRTQEDKNFSEKPFLNVCDCLIDALLRRGFLVMRKDGGILLCPGTLAEDVELLFQLLHVRQRHAEGEWGVPVFWNDRVLARLDVTPVEQVQSRYPSLFRPTRRISGFTGPQGSASKFQLTWEGFQKCRFGANMPLKNLEAGIALLVKVLPWCGVRTSMSCEGHEKGGCYGPPSIWFFGCNHGMWCKAIFDHLFGAEDFAHQWEFSFNWEQDSWSGAIWRGGLESLSSSEHIECCMNAQIAARSLMLPGLSEKIRAAKAAASCIEELQPSLEAHVPIKHWAAQLEEGWRKWKEEGPIDYDEQANP